MKRTVKSKGEERREPLGLSSKPRNTTEANTNVGLCLRCWTWHGGSCSKRG